MYNGWPEQTGDALLGTNFWWIKGAGNKDTDYSGDGTGKLYTTSMNLRGGSTEASDDMVATPNGAMSRKEMFDILINAAKNWFKDMLIAIDRKLNLKK